MTLREAVNNVRQWSIKQMGTSDIKAVQRGLWAVRDNFRQNLKQVSTKELEDSLREIKGSVAIFSGMLRKMVLKEYLGRKDRTK